MLKDNDAVELKEVGVSVGSDAQVVRTPSNYRARRSSAFQMQVEYARERAEHRLQAVQEQDQTNRIVEDGEEEDGSGGGFASPLTLLFNGDFAKFKDRMKWQHFWTWLKSLYAFYKSFIIAVVVVGTWACGGALFYHLYYDWPYSSSLYYASQAGLSIGFGALAETDDTSRFFTVIFVMLGSSMIAGALGLFVNVILEKHDLKVEIKKREALKARTVMSKKAASSSLTHSSSHYVDGGDSNAQEKDSCKERLLWHYREHNTEYNCAMVVLVWISYGLFYGMYYDDHSFIQGIYFSVTALSTGGLQAPIVPDQPGDETFRMVLLALFCLTGVPVYGLALGQGASLLVSSFEDNKLKKDLERAISMSEFQYALELGADISGDPDTNKNKTIDYARFLEFSMLRLGMCNRDTLLMIRKQFKDLDVDGDGLFSSLEMHAALSFARFDTDNSGYLDLHEFLLLVEELQLVPPDSKDSIEEIEKAYELINTDADGRISRAEFAKWFFFVHTTDDGEEIKHPDGEDVAASSDSRTRAATHAFHRVKSYNRRMTEARKDTNRVRAQTHDPTYAPMVVVEE